MDEICPFFRPFNEQRRIRETRNPKGKERAPSVSNLLLARPEIGGGKGRESDANEGEEERKGRNWGLPTSLSQLSAAKDERKGISS